MSVKNEETYVPETPEPRTVEAVTAVTFVFTMEGGIAVGPTKEMALVRPPSDTDVRVLALFLYDQLVANPTPKPPEAQESLRERMARVLAERDG